MAKLADITFESGSLPTGATAVTSGSSTVSIVNGGLCPSSTKRLVVTQADNTVAYLKINLSTLAGTGQAYSRGIGGLFRCDTTINGDSIFGARPFEIWSGNTGTYLTSAIWKKSGVWSVYSPAFTPTLNIINNSGPFPYDVVPDDGNIHSFFFGYSWSATANSGEFNLYIDNKFVFGGTADNTTALASSAGNGILYFYLGVGSNNATGQNGTISYDSIYITDSVVPAVSSEWSSVISGYSGPISPTANTVTLSSTAASPVWSSSDNVVMSVSSGIVTLNQANGGLAYISDGETQVLVEFLPRTSVWTPNTLSGSGPYTSTITLSSVSDGVTTYPDLVPGTSSSSNYSLPNVTGSSGSFTLSIPSLASGAWQGYINRHLWNLTSSSATESSYITGVLLSPLSGTVNGGQTLSFTSSATGVGSFSSGVTYSASAGSINSSGVFTAPSSSTPQTVTITSTSTQDNTVSSTAQVTVPASNVNHYIFRRNNLWISY